MKSYFALLFVVCTIAGCHTFTRIRPDYSELPVDSLRDAAYEIERAVQDGNRTPGIANRDGIVLETEVVRQAIRARAARIELVNDFRDTGFCYEAPDGLLTIQRNSAYKKASGSREKKRDALLVFNENQNRWAIYEAIVEESNFPPKSLSAVQETFFEARLKVLPDGQKYKDESGQITHIGGPPESGQ